MTGIDKQGFKCHFNHIVQLSSKLINGSWSDLIATASALAKIFKYFFTLLAVLKSIPDFMDFWQKH